MFGGADGEVMENYDFSNFFTLGIFKKKKTSPVCLVANVDISDKCFLFIMGKGYVFFYWLRY